MVKTQAVHRYIRNLLDAQERLRMEHDKTVAWERAVREELMNARLELQRMRSLAERGEAKIAALAEKSEQIRMDAVALSQFNQRTPKPAHRA
jgi:flagellar biosynthesis chaperone FliJ